MSKKKKLKLPKEVAGIKLPKDLRRAGNALIDHAASPEGRQLIAAGLTAAAAAIASKSVPPVATPGAEKPAGDPLGQILGGVAAAAAARWMAAGRKEPGTS